MAEIVVSAVVGVLIEKLISGALMKFARSEGIDSQLKKWKKKLLLIQDLLADAGQKEITQRAVGRWLIELQDLAYDIEDVVDDIATEAMKRKFEESQASTSSSSKVLKIFPSCCTTFTPPKMMYGHKMSSKLDEIMTRLNDLFKQKSDLGLVEYVNVDTSRLDKTDVRFNQTSLIDESKVLGREDDKAALLEKLLGGEESSNRNVSIVSIVGMGGIGKTTLAQILYNDEKVNDHFEVMAWVCVSDDFDVVNISNQIYQDVVGENKNFSNLNQLQVALKKILSNKRFLLVLDDVWNEDPQKWELLQQPLMGAPGSKVLLTTRNTKVSSVMNSIQPYELEVLSDDLALSLFARSALDEENFDKHQSLKFIAQGIVKKCRGLPLALIALGRVLKNKEKVKWEELLNNEIWNLQGESGILPALKLSYYHLPSHLKQLFAYCSLFPKDYVFEKKKLVLLWMAQGFLSQTNDIKQRMESLGDDYFNELLSRSFIQSLGTVKSRYIMHDLMNDLATSVAGEFFFRLDDKVDTNGRDEAYEKFRHFSFISQQPDAKYKKFQELRKARCLRTFLPVSVGLGEFETLEDVIAELYPDLHRLRVLSLTEYSITKVPQSIGNLKLLRYLNFSETEIQQIPEEVGQLYNLQTLLVAGCSELSGLPVSLVKLINLRHLDMTGTPLLKKLPLGIGGLTSLQTLSKVVIEGGNGFKVSELKGLSDLQGALSIEGLEKVIEPIEAEDANLQQKKGLDDLDMKWSDIFDDSRDPDIEYEILERLRAPHSNLKKLKITGYGGMKFPNWVGDPSFDHLTNLTLRGCENCRDLPTLGNLSSLRELCLRSMKEVKTVGFELLSSTKPFPGNAFPSLESLEVRDMESLEMWSTSGGDMDETPRSFPSLRVISITECPKLSNVSFGLIPSLKDLNVEGCPEAVFRNIVGVSSSIRTLKLRAIEGLNQLDIEVIKHLGAVEDLRIQNCDELRYLWESESEACRFLGSLQKLEVVACSKLESIMGDKEVVNVGSSIMGSLRQVEISYCDSLASYCCPNSIEKLELTNCSSMTSLSFSKLEDEDLPSSSSSLLSSNLKILEVSFCENIKSISAEYLQRLASLEEMKIFQCPSMDDSFPSSGLLWPPNLKSLTIGELKKPMSEWGVINYPSSLVELRLYGINSGVVSFGIMEHEALNNMISSAACYLLPPSLTALGIYVFDEVESVSEVLQHLPLLQQLEIWICWKLRDVPKSTSSLTVHVIN